MQSIYLFIYLFVYLFIYLFIRSIGCLSLNGSEVKHCISEVEANIKLCASSFSVVTLPLSTWSKSSSVCMYTALDSWAPSLFASVEEMFSTKHKGDCVLWLAQLKSYICV